MNCLIRNARICDPSRGIDQSGDFCIEDGRIVEKPSGGDSQLASIPGENLIVTPGFVDLHVHFREPGGEESETIESGSRAAARGGFTHVVTMPNTTPPTDTADLLRQIIQKSNAIGLTTILPSACATVGREGKKITDLKALSKAGAAAFTDDGSAVEDGGLMMKLLESSAELGTPILQHAVDSSLSGNGVIRDCKAAKELSLPVFDPTAESSIAARDIDLAAKTNGILHIQHISSGETADIIRAARSQGLRVSGEATPHHLAFSTDDIPGDDPNYKMNPPLGTVADRKALLDAITDGTISCLATDHAPHIASKKASGIAGSAFGVIGLETAAAVTYDLLVASKLISLQHWIALWTTGPAAILGIANPSLQAGSIANIAVFEIGERTIKAEDLRSKSLNCPFIGWKTSLNPVLTVCNGRESWRAQHS